MRNAIHVIVLRKVWVIARKKTMRKSIMKTGFDGDFEEDTTIKVGQREKANYLNNSKEKIRYIGTDS